MTVPAGGSLHFHDLVYQAGTDRVIFHHQALRPIMFIHIHVQWAQKVWRVDVKTTFINRIIFQAPDVQESSVFFCCTDLEWKNNLKC
jgi:hypothetical protein